MNDGSFAEKFNNKKILCAKIHCPMGLEENDSFSKKDPHIYSWVPCMYLCLYILFCAYIYVYIYVSTEDESSFKINRPMGLCHPAAPRCGKHIYFCMFT